MSTFEIKVRKDGKPEEGLDDGDICFYINGKFQASWGPNSQGPKEVGPVLRQMFQMVFEEGERSQSSKIRKLLGY